MVVLRVYPPGCFRVDSFLAILTINFSPSTSSVGANSYGVLETPFTNNIDCEQLAGVFLGMCMCV